MHSKGDHEDVEAIAQFLNHIDIYHTSPCFAEAGKIRVKAKLSDDISELLPYLNRVIKNANYNAYAPNITLFKEFRMITIEPTNLILIKALNDTDARQILAWLKDLINDTAERRNEIEPLYESQKRPHPLQLYTWLPRTNCKQCGEKSCLAFAALLFVGQQSLENCSLLFTKDYEEPRNVILKLVEALGHDMSQIYKQIAADI
jgi:ArsR family metal-binding transcriptional regulator